MQKTYIDFYLQCSYAKPYKSDARTCLICHRTEYQCHLYSENRYFHSDVELKHHDVGKGWIFISASAWKNSIGATIGGVGKLLSPLAHKALTSIEEIEPRVLIASFNVNPKTTIISCYYSPTNSSDEDEVTHFYICLSSLVRQVPNHNVLIIGGVVNA